MRALRYAAIGIAAVLVLAVAAAVVVSLAVDPNRYKPEIVRLVQEKTGRTLTIDGGIALTFFPRLGVAVEKVTLSGPGGSGRFASVAEARVAVALLPLLAKRVVVDRIELAGLEAELVRRKDGSTNFDDLLGKEAGPAAGAPGKEPSAPSAPALEIGGLGLRDANVVWRDEGKAQTVKLAGLDVRTGRIAEGARGRLEVATRIAGSGPPLNLAVKGSADYRLDLARGAFALEDLDLRVNGDAPGAAGLAAHAKGSFEIDPARELLSVAKLALGATTRDGLELKADVPKLRIAPEGAAGDAASAELKLARAGRTAVARVALSPLATKGPEVRFERLAVDAEVRQGEATFATRIAAPLAIDRSAKTARLAPLAGEIVATGPHLPQRSVKGSLAGSARAAWGKPSSAAADLLAKLEDATLKATLAVANLDAPAFDFDLAADRLDVDRYLPPPRQPAAGVGGAPSGRPAAQGPAASDDTPIDLAFLKPLNGRASVRIGALSVRNVKAQNVDVGLRAAAGRVDVAPLNATLYQGTLAGSASIDAHANRFAVREQLNGVALGPLLRDAAQFDRIEGRGNVALDLAATGTTLAALKRSLGGTARVELRDGAVRGIDLDAIVRAAGALLGSTASGESRGQAGGETRFSELSASFVIRNGVARNDDLAGRSPLVRVSGAGTIDIGAGTIDYLVRATPVAPVPIGGGRQLTVLQGVAVPVRLSGPLTSPGYSVDMAQLALESAKTGVRLSIGKGTGGGAAVEDALRGILRRK